ncbi:MAG: cytochrome b/b6 domain-containing protein [Phycisphaerales bacterium]|nr:cytochrome b/b6 domain-containing protein [Planctomycetota bacterium]
MKDATDKPRILIWDLPVRLFHVGFASCWIAALFLALGFSHSSRWFPYHSLVGLVLAFVVALRIAWAFAGTRHAKLGAFLYSPMAVFQYLKSALTWKDTRHQAHNPASAYAILAMIALTVAQVVTGLLVGSGNRRLKDVHEMLAYAMIAVIVTHVLGVVLHTIRHREFIALSMITGLKPDLGPEGSAQPIRSSRPVAAVILVLATFAFAAAIFRSYNPIRQSTRLPVLGIEIPIGESEEDSE